MSERKAPTIYLVDGSNYVFRAFYAIPGLSNSRGFPTNAVYGFTNMLMKLIREKNPPCIAVAFDVKGPTFRHEAFAAYKATRTAPPEALLPQIPYIKDIVRGLSIPILEREGVEADDIIGTLARRFEEQGADVVIVSGDKDMMQLVSDRVTMLDTMKDKLYDRQVVQERFGVPPEKVVEILGLVGDASDNIPGVPGIGPKGAQRLIEQFGTVEGVLAGSDKIHNARMREALRDHADQARLSRTLALIDTHLDIDLDLEACRRREPDKALLGELFREMEFTSLLEGLDIHRDRMEGRYGVIAPGEELDAVIARIRERGEMACDVVLSSPEPMRAEIVGLALSLEPGESRYMPLPAAGGGAGSPSPRPALPPSLALLLADGKIKKYGHDLKSAVIALARRDAPLRGLAIDTMVASYLLNPALHSFELADIARDHLGRGIVSAKELLGSGARAVPVQSLPEERVAEYACQRADAAFSLARALAEKVREGGIADLLHRVEMPLVSVLAAMERKGVLLDLSLLQDLSRELAGLLGRVEEKIWGLAGERFNIGSPKQLQAILFETLKLPKGRKTKEGYSTDVDVLTNLAKDYELPAEILVHRSLAKLKSTYIDALPVLVNPETGRVHTSYNQTVAATGRLSSSNPNLQNIPVRSVEGKRIRQAFIAPEGWCLISADYSQIELRVLAHLSGDDALREAFLSGEDIHRRTASDVFGVFPEMVSPEMRRQAKVINFGVIYGMSAFGLAKELDISTKLAQAYIDGYFRKFKGVRDYLDGILACARRDGYVTTLLGRRRYLPEINSTNPTLRQFAERMAVNAPIQGTAADLIKVAMLNIAQRFGEKGLSAAMIMQVHDELVCEVPEIEKEESMAVLKREMEDVIALDVPLLVECAAGRNWDEAHG
jgi:DNA polymerase I